MVLTEVQPSLTIRAAPLTPNRWFAAQDGSGAWVQVNPSGAVYRFTISSATGGAYASAVRSASGATLVTVNLLTRSELTTAPIVACPVPAGNKTISATIAAVDEAFVSFGGSSVDVSANGVVPIPNVPNGTYDLIGWRFNGGRGINTATSTRAVIIRDVAPGDGESAGIIDFGAGDAVIPIEWSVVFGGARSGDAFTGSMTYYTGARDRCIPALLYNFSNTTPSVPGGAYGFPESAQRTTDIHVLRVSSVNGPNMRVAQQAFHTAGNVSTLGLGDLVSQPRVDDLGGAHYRRLQVTGTTPPLYSSTMSFAYSDETSTRSALIQTSVARIGGNTATISFPEFSSVGGWDSSWLPSPTSSVNWTFGGTSATYTGLPCFDGATFLAAYYSGTQ